uniref:MORN repeat-containing protein 3 n=1 Tax=Tetraselmis sp. GSL018 TaxID=582737 RepID=A0A061S1V4_9CHLO|mmetsp:Transcript_38433/g.91167  ORF Transcript_38433/g.91167 Transcript_38433/m.91167 type:complete len:386 (+) Transcript_38433:312-1469(+)
MEDTGEGGSRRARTLRNPTTPPSVKYPPVAYPSTVILQRASSPPSPTLPRKPTKGLRTSKALTESLKGRAGKYGELVGKNGGHYCGEILAGRPHGNGQYFVPAGPSSRNYRLQYDGEWIQGRREGHGIRYYPTNEVYTGDFVNNERHGYGRMDYGNGSSYEGQWVAGRKRGLGTLYFANGDFFVGYFMDDKREGLGTLYMVEKGKKMIGEWVSDSCTSSSVLQIEDGELSPLDDDLRETIEMSMAEVAEETEQLVLPKLDLKQPNKLLARQFAGIRKMRMQDSKAQKTSQEQNGTLSHTEIEMLRLSFILMAGGEDVEVGVLTHQLRELTVMAGLDPAQERTPELVADLVRQKRSNGRIYLDDFLKIVAHYRDHSTAEVPIPDEW